MLNSPSPTRTFEGAKTSYSTTLANAFPNPGVEFHLQQLALRRLTAGGRIIMQLAAARHDTMAWHDQRHAVLAHHVADGSSRTGSPGRLGQVAVAEGGTGRNVSTFFDDRPLESR